MFKSVGGLIAKNNKIKEKKKPFVNTHIRNVWRHNRNGYKAESTAPSTINTTKLIKKN